MLMDVAKFIVTDIIISVAAGILKIIIIPVIISDIIVIAVAITFVVILEQLDNEIFHTSNDFKKAIKGGWAVHNQHKGDRGYSSIAKKIGTTQSVLTKLNGVKVIHPGDKLKYKKAHMEQYIPGWLLFTPENIQKQYNIDPTKVQPGHRGDHTYADKIRFTYALIVADESK
ncbi:LysM peptidoglycan-binding domain-containing protein [Salmonella enterica]|nr:LysM peptidoglycan-binding domain-containing protein [Salmonella enterica subsp. enterica serovar Agona]EEP6504096.1 LysM peptidoglycan-binding domain-containing protein [Salmonella enterica]EBM8724850.1 LysM peptidoglycan-binding domain-containing protein [Salmonella enterica subsp. enterica serovar Agona]EFO6945106.1 LysM peptidoglycan-binding domain-containing protein [Salmonella enterica]EFO8359242.1 LysM peptidoglycan-binding domain-containing protein [Salmonella enterica]